MAASAEIKYRALRGDGSAAMQVLYADTLAPAYESGKSLPELEAFVTARLVERGFTTAQATQLVAWLVTPLV